MLADYGGDYRLGLLAECGPVMLTPDATDPAFFLDDEIVFWRFCCPGCQMLMSTQVRRAGDPFVTEMRLG